MASTPTSEFKVKISAVNTATAAFDKAVVDFERAAAAGKDTTSALARVAKAFQQLEANGNATSAVLERGAQALARAEEATAAAAEAAKAHAEALAKEREEAEASEKGFRGLLNSLKELQELGEKTASKGGVLGGLGGAALDKGVGHAAKAGFGQILGFAAESVAAYRGVSAVLDTVKEGIEDGIKNNSEYERSVLRIQNTLRNTGSIAGVSAGQIAELTEGLEKTTFITKMQAQSMQGRLLQSPNLRGEDYEKALRTSADLSEQLQIDPDQAATLITRASEHPTDALKMLKRQGLNVSDTDVEDLKKTEAAQGVTAAFEQLEKIINRIAGGAASAAHQGAAGSVDLGNKGVEAFWMNLTGGGAGRALGRGYADFGQGLAWLSDSKLRDDAARTRGNADALLSGNYKAVRLEGNNTEQREQLEQVENLLKSQKAEMLQQYAALPVAPDASRQHAREAGLERSTERYHAAGEQIEELLKARSGDDPQTMESNRKRDEDDLTRIVQESADERDKIVKGSAQTQAEAYRAALAQIAADEKAATADSGGNAGKISQSKGAADTARASVTKNYIDSINKSDGSDALERELAIRQRINAAVREGTIPQSQAAQALKDQLDISQKLLNVDASAVGQVRDRLSLLTQQNEAAEKQAQLMSEAADFHAQTVAKVAGDNAYRYTLARTGDTKAASRAERDAQTQSDQDEYERHNNLSPDSAAAQAHWSDLQSQNASSDARSQQDEATAASQARTKAVEDFRNAQQRAIDTNNAEIQGLEQNGRASEGVTAKITAYADIEKQIATLKRENKGLSDSEIADMRSLGDRAADTAEKLQKLKAAQEFLASIDPNIKLGQDAKKNQDLVGVDGITQTQVDAANKKSSWKHMA